MNILPEQIIIFRSLFYGQNNVYGTYDPLSGKSWQVKAPITDEVIKKHLAGIQPFGVYLLTKDKTSAVVADFDDQDAYPVRELYLAAKHSGLPAFIEKSKSKGFHCWVFFDQPVIAYKARLVMKHLLKETEGPNIEIFPKQDTLDHTSFGNFINTPLFGKLVSEDKTVFIDIEQGLRPYKDPWELLRSVHRANESQLDEIIQTNELDKQQLSTSEKVKQISTRCRGLLPCAQVMLKGVSKNQRVIAFRLAIHLKRLGFSIEVATDILHSWTAKNNPLNGRTRIKSYEIISQVRSAYDHDYASYGCSDPMIVPYCDQACPIYQKINESN